MSPGSPSPWTTGTPCCTSWSRRSPWPGSTARTGAGTPRPATLSSWHLFSDCSATSLPDRAAAPHGRHVRRHARDVRTPGLVVRARLGARRPGRPDQRARRDAVASTSDGRCGSPGLSTDMRGGGDGPCCSPIQQGRPWWSSAPPTRWVSTACRGGRRHGGSRRLVRPRRRTWQASDRPDHWCSSASGSRPGRSREESR